MNPRAITGWSALSCAGVGREAFERALGNPDGHARVPSPITAFDTAPYPDATGQLAEVVGFDATQFLGDKGLRSLDRQTKLLVVAARLGLADAGLKKDNAFVALGPELVGFCASNAYGSLEAVSELDRVAVLEDARYINPAKFPNTVANSASGYVSIWEDLRALNVSISDGNCGALDSVTCADVYLETGRAAAVVVGGVEALSEPLYVGYLRLGGLMKGTTLSEGAALFVLETLASARGRGARIDALVLGAGAAFGSPPREGMLLHASPDAVERAVRGALEDAGVAASEIDLVVSGVDVAGPFAKAEIEGALRALGERVAIAAPKRVFGETLGASGAIGLAAGLTWLKGTPVTTLVRGAAPSAVRTVVVTSIGYYGNASAVVVRRG